MFFIILFDLDFIQLNQILIIKFYLSGVLMRVVLGRSLQTHAEWAGCRPRMGLYCLVPRSGVHCCNAGW